jgi:hypothetical protein
MRCAFFILVVFVVATVGGCVIGMSHGTLGAVIGAVGGFLAVVLSAMLLDGLSRLWRRWRPTLPPCPCGRRGRLGIDLEFQSVRADGARELRCACGAAYVWTGRRCVISQDTGAVQCYERRGLLGRWLPVHTQPVAPGPETAHPGGKGAYHRGAPSGSSAEASSGSDPK